MFIKAARRMLVELTPDLSLFHTHKHLKHKCFRLVYRCQKLYFVTFEEIYKNVHFTTQEKKLRLKKFERAKKMAIQSESIIIEQSKIRKKLFNLFF
jgi:hypothetical protein